jgi:hypothetical protein
MFSTVSDEKCPFFPEQFSMVEQRCEKVAPGKKASDEPIRPDATKIQLRENDRGFGVGIILEIGV